MVECQNKYELRIYQARLFHSKSESTKDVIPCFPIAPLGGLHGEQKSNFINLVDDLIGWIGNKMRSGHEHL
jgi:hypothetical protein